MKTTLKRNLLPMFILVSLSALLGGCQDERYNYATTLRNTVMSLHVGDEWKTQYNGATGMAVVEETREYTKYRFDDWTAANTKIWYTVKKNEIVAVWRNE